MATKGSKPRHTPVRLSHRDATSNSTTKGRLTTGDIGVFAFTLSLILLGIFLAAYSDRPVFWLLVAPGPIAIGFTLIAFRRQGFGRRDRTTTMEKLSHSGERSGK